MKHSQSRKWWLGLLAVVVLGGAAWRWIAGSDNRRGNTPGQLLDSTFHEAKARATKMTMRVASTSITGIEQGRIQMESQVVLDNPLPVALNASRLEYATLINGEKVSEGVYTKPIHIPAAESLTLTLPSEMLVKPMGKVLKEMEAAGEDTATYTFLNTIHTDVPVAGQRKIPFNIEERLPVVKPPKIKPGKIDLQDVGIEDTEMDLTVQVTNPNSFPITMQEGHYTMTLDGKHTLEGSMQKEVRLPAKETVPVSMHLDMKTGGALKMGWKMLFDKKETRYELTFDGEIVSNEKMLRNSSMHLREEGTLQDLTEALKTK